MPKYRFAKSSGFVNVGAEGVSFELVAGRAYTIDHPAVRQYPHLFSDEPTVYDWHGPVVEQATAAPGEKRATRGR